MMGDAPTGFRVSWQEMEIARSADRLGMEVMVPLGRWTVFPGSAIFNVVYFKTYTWAAGLARPTENSSHRRDRTDRQDSCGGDADAGRS